MSSRQLLLNENPQNDGGCVIYVVSRDIRVRDNHALVIAQKSALESKLPLIVVFNLLNSSGFRSREHFEFLLNGLDSFRTVCEKLNIKFMIFNSSSVSELAQDLQKLNPKEILFDFSPLRGPRLFQKKFANSISCRVSVVDNHNIIPAWLASNKEEFAAYTFRPKVYKQLENWLVEPEQVAIHPYSSELICNFNLVEALKFTNKIQSSGIIININPGEQEADKTLKDFINKKIDRYHIERNKPEIQGQSNLSPYLHYGYISSLRIALELVNNLDNPSILFSKNKVSLENGHSDLEISISEYLEELIVRKELSENYCFYNSNYDNFQGAKPWAVESLNNHRNDPREFLYTSNELEFAITHDTAWNAAQKQMTTTGKMHGYMRMYWAKKILEWSQTPEEAIKIGVYLNDKYSIDGGDPNGYTGIMWSMCGIHDRAWFDRQIFGKIRYMNYGGLKRKFDISKYEEEWNEIKLDI